MRLNFCFRANDEVQQDVIYATVIKKKSVQMMDNDLYGTAA